MSISSIGSDKELNTAWEQAQTSSSSTQGLPKELDEESKKHYHDINVRPFFGMLALEQEKLRDGKVLMKNTEIKALRDKLHLLTDFLDKANCELQKTTSNNIVMTEHAELISEIKKILPEGARKLIGDRTKFNRREVENLCQMITRNIDGEITPQIEERKDEIVDIMQLLDKILPMLKDLLKKYNEHIDYIISKSR